MEQYIPTIKELINIFEHNVHVDFTPAHEMFITLGKLTITWVNLHSYFISHNGKPIYVEFKDNSIIINEEQYNFIFSHKTVSMLNNVTKEHSIINQDMNDGNLSYINGIFTVLDDNENLIEYDFTTDTFILFDKFIITKDKTISFNYSQFDIKLYVQQINKRKIYDNSITTYDQLLTLSIQNDNRNIISTARYYFEQEKMAYNKYKISITNKNNDKELLIKQYNPNFVVKYDTLHVSFSSVDVYLQPNNGAIEKYARYNIEVNNDHSATYYRDKFESQLYDKKFISLYPVVFNTFTDILIYYMVDYDLLYANIRSLL